MALLSIIKGLLLITKTKKYRIKKPLCTRGNEKLTAKYSPLASLYRIRNTPF
jgi:hypothetical protein